MELRNDFPGLYDLEFPSIQKLTVESTRVVPFGDTELEFYRDPVGLIVRNHSLLQLNLYRMPELYLRQGLWLRLANQFDHLREPYIYGGKLPSGSVGVFWRACSRLEKLELRLLEFPRNEGIPYDLVLFPQMRVLVLHMVKISEDIVTRCPGLSDLTWNDIEPLPLFQDVGFHQLLLVERGGGIFWSSMKNVCLGYLVSDRQIAALLNAMQQAKSLNFPATSFGSFAFQALAIKHFGSLKDIDLQGCDSVGSPMLCEILCSCPMLEELKGDWIIAKDVMQNKPWVCLSLRKLSLVFLIEQCNIHIKVVIQERLYSLRQLEQPHPQFRVILYNAL
ncbi:hypothetical protein BX616_001371 [Lobosporangium transversale]|nr:hypothetical protein BX616_001371 [Lobosporangium transversale]